MRHQLQGAISNLLALDPGLRRGGVFRL